MGFPSNKVVDLVAPAILSPVFFQIQTTQPHRRQDRRRYVI